MTAELNNRVNLTISYTASPIIDESQAWYKSRESNGNKAVLTYLGGHHLLGAAFGDASLVARLRNSIQEYEKPRRSAGLSDNAIIALGINGLEVAYDIAEHVADDGAQEQEDSNDHDGHKYQDQRVLDQALTFLTRKEQHTASPPFIQSIDSQVSMRSLAAVKLISHTHSKPDSEKSQ